MEPIIAMRGISKRFGSSTVLDNLDIEVRPASIFALLGPNGAGKTTVINILSTLVAPDAGTATVAGFDVVTERDGVKRSISLTGQSAAVDEILTGEENLVMMARLSGLNRAHAVARTEELLQQFDLVEARGKRVRTYSGGMRRRLDIAISLLLTPPIVFLDEPTTGLDTRSRQDLWNVIRTLAARGTTIFLTTQYLEEADQLADTVAVLDHGRIVAIGTANELKAQVGDEMVVLHDANGEVISQIATDGTLSGLRRALADLETDIDVTVSLRRPSLDDAFLALTGAPQNSTDRANKG